MHPARLALDLARREMARLALDLARPEVARPAAPVHPAALVPR